MIFLNHTCEYQDVTRFECKQISCVPSNSSTRGRRDSRSVQGIRDMSSVMASNWATGLSEFLQKVPTCNQEEIGKRSLGFMVKCI